MEVVDILFTDDIAIKDGDLDVGISDPQHIEHIFKASPGQFYQFLTLGIGIDKFKKASIHKPTLKQKIRDNLQADDFRINKIDVSGGIDQLLTFVDAKRRI